MNTCINFLTNSWAYSQFVYFCFMRLFKVILDFYLKASIHVALSVTALAFVGSKSLNISISYPLLCCLFFGALVAYNFIKYGVEAEYYMKVTKKVFLPIQILSILAAFFGFFAMLELPNTSYIIMAIMIFLTGLYAMPLLPEKRNLRNIGGVKIYIVSAVWAMASVLLPLSTMTTELLFKAALQPIYWLGVLSVWGSHFLLVLILMVPFEIRDWKTDQPQLKTIAQRYGLLKAKRLGYVWVIVFLLLQLFNGFVLEWSVGVAVLHFFVAAACGFSIFWSTETTAAYFTYFWVEAIPVFYAVGWWIISYF